jgi:hypothetical protein
MTDDLVKRLRGKHCCESPNCNCDEAADRIEALERELSLADDQRREWEHHCKTAEARLAKAVEALERCMVGGNHLAVWLPEPCPPVEAEPLVALEQIGAGMTYDLWCCWRVIMHARAVLAEIEGGKKDE